MKKLVLLFLLIFPFNLYAKDTEKYMVQRPDGGVSIVQYIPGSHDSLTDVLRELGFSNYPITAITDSDLPKDRTYREAWKKSGLKVIEDETKKEEIISEKSLHV